MTDEEREEFLQEANKIPPFQEYRLVLGYAEARLIQGKSSENALSYVWPWWNQPSNSSIPSIPDLSNGSFPDLKNIRTDWLSSEFEGIDSAPSRTDIEQENYLYLLRTRGFKFSIVDAESYNPNPTERHAHGQITPYNGLSSPERLYPWLEKLLSNNIVPIINIGTEGSPQSWANRAPNEWYWENIGRIAKTYYNFCSGHVIFLWGFEVDKRNADRSLNRAEQWGWRGGGITSMKVKDATGSPIYMHCNTESIGPVVKEDNPWEWTFEDFWLKNSAFDGLFLQTERDREDNYYRGLGRFVSKFHNIGKRIYAAEFTTMGADETQANRIGNILLGLGFDGTLNNGGR